MGSSDNLIATPTQVRAETEALRRLARDRHFFVVGLGTVAKTVLPLLHDRFGLSPACVTIISPDWVPGYSDRHYGHHRQLALTAMNLDAELSVHLKRGDVVLNLATEVSTADVIARCQRVGALYLDTVIEPWAGWYDNPKLSPPERSNYALREQVLADRGMGRSTAVLTHGANPGLVSHFVKVAIQAVADHLQVGSACSAGAWPQLAQAIGLKTIHISEYDSQHTHLSRASSEFMNTWSVAGFIAEANQPAELGWGTHERTLPEDGYEHETGARAAIWLDRPGASVKVASWAPYVGAFHGLLISHGESISLADHLTVRGPDGAVLYRPTVHYAYRPCDAALASLHDLLGRQWHTRQSDQRTLLTDVVDGHDTLGVLLGYGNAGAYWYGSRLSVGEARRFCMGTNATALQVAAGVLGGLVWAMENPDRGIVEPEDMDAQRVLEIARPYLGELIGTFTDWTPLAHQRPLFATASVDPDPWSFENVRVRHL